MPRVTLSEADIQTLKTGFDPSNPRFNPFEWYAALSKFNTLEGEAANIAAYHSTKHEELLTQYGAKDAERNARAEQQYKNIDDPHFRKMYEDIMADPYEWVQNSRQNNLENISKDDKRRQHWTNSNHTEVITVGGKPKMLWPGSPNSGPSRWVDPGTYYVLNFEFFREYDRQDVFEKMGHGFSSIFDSGNWKDFGIHAWKMTFGLDPHYIAAEFSGNSDRAKRIRDDFTATDFGVDLAVLATIEVGGRAGRGIFKSIAAGSEKAATRAAADDLGAYSRVAIDEEYNASAQVGMAAEETEVVRMTEAELAKKEEAMFMHLDQLQQAETGFEEYAKTLYRQAAKAELAGNREVAASLRKAAEERIADASRYERLGAQQQLKIASLKYVEVTPVETVESVFGRSFTTEEVEQMRSVDFWDNMFTAEVVEGAEKEFTAANLFKSLSVAEKENFAYLAGNAFVAGAVRIGQYSLGNKNYGNVFKDLLNNFSDDAGGKDGGTDSGKKRKKEDEYDNRMNNDFADIGELTASQISPTDQLVNALLAQKQYRILGYVVYPAYAASVYEKKLVLFR